MVNGTTIPNPLKTTRSAVACTVLDRCATMKPQRSTVRQIAVLVGESLREMAVLVIVFAPLDRLVQNEALTLRYWSATIAISAVLFVFGLILEVQWRWKH